MRISTLAEKDLARVVATWNTCLPHDQLSEERFRRVMLEDPNYEPDSLLLAEDAAGDIMGLIACAFRRTVEGRDGGGRPEQFARGYLKGFFVAESAEGESAADELLARAEAQCREAAKTELRVTMYTGPYVFPGLDVRYERLRAMLGKRGFRDIYTIEDVGVPLGPDVEARLKRAWERVGDGLVVRDWTPDLLPLMRPFVAEGKQAQWFPVGWEARYSEPDDTTLVLLRGGEIVGWAHYFPGERAGFGPTLVLDRERGHGYGALLLFECMVRAMRGGAKHMHAGWANTGFYIACGWQIQRRFAVLNKAL